MTDCNFPIIQYSPNHSPFEWGVHHGESFKEAINELVTIRRALMLKRNPSLENSVNKLALEQFEKTKELDLDLAQELEGIAKGADLDLVDIVVLNNYTDFRDIQLPDEGCSTIHFQGSDHKISGQTWDMHRSAKNYMCIIEVPKTETTPETLVLSLVGCTGLMGINSSKCFIGVNNINTLNAEVGIIWPNLVRKVLKDHTLKDMRETLNTAQVTSGHNYLISSLEGAEHWEITPEYKDLVSAHDSTTPGFSFHTNHCLGENVSKIEDKNHVSLTTHKRYKILDNKVKNLKSFDDLKTLLQSHEEHPTGICTHLETGAKDPSATCGGGIFNSISNRIEFWRGCPDYDSNYIEYKYTFNEDKLIFKRE